MQNEEYIIDLWNRYLQNRASSAEVKELFAYLLSKENNNDVIVLLQRVLDASPGKMLMDPDIRKKMLLDITSTGQKDKPSEPVMPRTADAGPPVIPLAR